MNRRRTLIAATLMIATGAGCTGPRLLPLDARYFSNSERSAIVADLAARDDTLSRERLDDLRARWDVDEAAPGELPSGMHFERAVVVQRLIELGTSAEESREAAGELSADQLAALADDPQRITAVGDPATALLLGVLATASLASANDCQPPAPAPPPPPVVELTETRSWEVAYQENVYIATEPPGARIYVAGDYVGVSPVTARLERLDLRLTNSGTYRDQCGRRKSRTVWRDDIHAAVETGTWTITAVHGDCHPASRDITVSRDATSFNRAVDGIRISRRGRVPDVVRGQRSILMLLDPIPAPEPVAAIIVPEVEPPPAPPSTGMLSVSSKPELCDVYIDGAFVGSTPFDVTLEPGTHTLEIKKANYEVYKRNVVVRPAQIVPVFAELQAADVASSQ